MRYLDDEEDVRHDLPNDDPLTYQPGWERSLDKLADTDVPSIITADEASRMTPERERVYDGMLAATRMRQGQ